MRVAGFRGFGLGNDQRRTVRGAEPDTKRARTMRNTMTATVRIGRIADTVDTFSWFPADGERTASAATYERTRSKTVSAPHETQRADTRSRRT